jgi:hypothetical protein
MVFSATLNYNLSAPSKLYRLGRPVYNHQRKFKYRLRAAHLTSFGLVPTRARTVSCFLSESSKHTTWYSFTQRGPRRRNDRSLRRAADLHATSERRPRPPQVHGHSQATQAYAGTQAYSQAYDACRGSPCSIPRGSPPATPCRTRCYVVRLSGLPDVIVGNRKVIVGPCSARCIPPYTARSRTSRGPREGGAGRGARPVPRGRARRSRRRERPGGARALRPLEVSARAAAGEDRCRLEPRVSRPCPRPTDPSPRDPARPCRGRGSCRGVVAGAPVALFPAARAAGGRRRRPIHRARTPRTGKESALPISDGNYIQNRHWKKYLSAVYRDTLHRR